MCCGCFAAEGVPFRYNEVTTSVQVTRHLDREERERYELIAKCTVREGLREMQVEVPFLVNVLDEDDSPPFLPNGTDTADAVVEFNRKEVMLVMFSFTQSLKYEHSSGRQDSWEASCSAWILAMSPPHHALQICYCKMLFAGFLCPKLCLT